MNEVHIIGLGAGDLNQLPVGVYRTLKNAKKLYVRTADHPVLQELQAEGLEYTSFDAIYEKHDEFEPVYRDITEELIRLSEDGTVIYAVPGHPLVAEQTVQFLIEAENEGRISLKIEGGQSFLDPIFAALRIDPIEGFQLLDGTSFSRDDVRMDQHVLIAQVYDAFSASEVKLTLMEKYADDYPVKIVTAAGSEKEKIVKVPLYELDRSMDIDNLTTVYVPPVREREERLKEWSTFREIIAILRSPEGCPWDREQTHESLKKYLIEEAYEVLQAIDDEDDNAIIEELGDILLQVFLHAQIGEDDGYFSMEDILESINAKMIRRHPHVFGDIEVINSGEVLKNWQEIKAEEKGNDQKEALLKGQFRADSSLLTSFNYQKTAAKVGFDWPDVNGAWEKFEEEWQEFRVETENGTKKEQTDELGDVFFTLVNIARFFKISPEEAMAGANRKFFNRFSYVEQKVLEGRGDFADYTLEELDAFWNEAKTLERK